MRASHQYPWWLRYGFAAVSVALVGVLRWSLDPILGEHLPSIMFLLAVVATSWLFDLGPAIVCIALGCVAADFFFVEPRFSLLAQRPQDWVEAGVFVLVASCFVLVTHVQKLAAQRLEASRREALHKSHLLEREVQAHREAEESLRRTEARNFQLLEQAAQANAAKDDFIAVLSHELRTPLTPIVLTVSWLETQKSLPAEVKSAVQVLGHNAHLEARLIDDLLDVNRIARGKIELHREIVDLHHVLEYALATCREDIHTRRLTLSQSLRAGQTHVSGDSARLQQVFWNLLKNAVKFTTPGGSITLRSSNPLPEQICVEVQDTGIGIESDRLGPIFNAFEQGGASITRRFGGLGLGLAISKGIVELHGGRITASSGGMGQGATFAVSLPLVAEPSALQGRVHDAPVAAARRELSILVVEDHASTAQVMARLLAHLGYHATIASSVAEAMAAVAVNHFDLLISDLGLPDASGYDLMRQVQAEHPMPGIALSGYGMEEDIKRSREAGFAQHLTKPIDLQRLAGAIEEVARSAEAAARPAGAAATA